MSEVALVTGGARRIGQAIVARLAEAGYSVAIHCRDSRHEAEALAAALPGRHAVLAADLADPDETAALVARAQAALGPVTLLVNNASLFLPDGLTALDPAQWDRQFAVNLRAPSVLAGAFANLLPAGRQGAIVNLIDQRVLRPTPQFYSYTLTKAALWTATRTMAQALAPRIRVNAIGPGPVLPNSHDGPEALAREVAAIPLQRRVEPAEIADAVLYLARAASVTGQMIAVDAGQHLGWRTPDVAD